MVRVEVRLSGEAKRELDSLELQTGRSTDSLIYSAIRVLKQHHRVKLHGGKVEIVSEAGKRTEFVVVF